MTPLIATYQAEKPSIVVNAVRLLYLTLAIGVVRSILEWSRLLEVVSAGFALIVMVFTLGVMAFLFYVVGRGSNWARIILLILTILSCPLSVPRLLQSLEYSPLSGGLGLSQVVLQTVALIMLFDKNARTWFRPLSQPSQDSQ